MSVVYSPLLSRIPGIKHGFGTKHAGLTQDGMASLKQIHSGIVLLADRSTGCMGEGDALVASEPGVVVSIRTADCLPILIADPVRGVVAAVHAGWRGTVAKVVTQAVEKMGSRAEDIHAAIGPGIGKCCYEVGTDVAVQLGEAQAGRVDLAEHNFRQLTLMGVRAERIEVLGLCTFCNTDEFWSYRREGERAGRMISFIELV